MIVLSLWYDRLWGGFRPLYRACFLGSLATRYVGHSSRACRKWAGTPDDVDGYPKDLLVKLMSSKGTLHQASNVNGTGIQTHNQVIFVSSPNTAQQLWNRGDFALFAVYYCYYGSLYNRESSQMLDSTRANTRKAQRNVPIS